jgi:ribosome-associated heat shock protein Hsp15
VSISSVLTAWEYAPMGEAHTPVRVDRWLWAARLVKTRGLAAEAIKGGRVRVNGDPVKPSREIRPGDLVEITTGPVRRAVEVRGTAERRGPARKAALLYEETAESRERRESQAAEARLAGASTTNLGARPTKRDRRRFEKTPGGRRRA